ncbi:MAG: class I adenylate-forming enzyme family protein [Rhodospirillales bacterium]
MADIPAGYQSMRKLIARQAMQFGGNTYIHAIDQDKNLSYQDLFQLGNRMAQFFQDRGIGANDRILMLSDNSVEFVAIFLGVQRYGATIATANVEMNRQHLAEIIRALDPKLILVEDGLGFEDLRRQSSDYDWMSIGEWRAEGGSTEFFGSIENYSADADIAEVCGPGNIAVIFYTSGTEAKPKGVLQTHLNVWANYDASADCVELGPGDRMLDCRSYTWLSSQNMSLGGPLMRGATVYMAKRFSRRRYFEWVAKYEIHIAIAVPAILNILMTEPGDIHGRRLPHLRFLMTSSAPMLPDQWAEFEKTYGMRVCQSYGCSEGGLMCSHRGRDRKIGTVGPPLKYQMLRILGADGSEMPEGQPGEITVSGPQTSYAYLEPDGRVELLPAAGHRTGDLGIRGAGGHITVVGRLKDQIIRGGVNISPTEIDNILARHADIIDAAAVGVPDEIYGEEVVAYVVARQAGTLSAATVIAHCGQYLAPFKTPKEIYFIDEIPKNARGKLDRDVLAGAWKRENA